MNNFYNQMFNPQYVNQENYFRILQQQQYEFEQNAEITKAVKAMHDLLVAMKNIDENHQQAAFNACLTEMAIQFGWNNGR